MVELGLNARTFFERKQREAWATTKACGLAAGVVVLLVMVPTGRELIFIKAFGCLFAGVAILIAGLRSLRRQGLSISFVCSKCKYHIALEQSWICPFCKKPVRGRSIFEGCGTCPTPKSVRCPSIRCDEISSLDKDNNKTNPAAFEARVAMPNRPVTPASESADAIMRRQKAEQELELEVERFKFQLAEIKAKRAAFEKAPEKTQTEKWNDMKQRVFEADELLERELKACDMLYPGDEMRKERLRAAFRLFKDQESL